MSKPTLSRKDVSILTGFSTETIKRKEKFLGLDKARIDTGTNRILYSYHITIATLKARRILV